MKKDLVKIIKENPGCVAIIDNDCWTLYRENPYDPKTATPEDDWKAFSAWEEQNTLATDGEVINLGSGYGSGNCYGGDVLQALAVIVGVKIESV